MTDQTEPDEEAVRSILAQVTGETMPASVVARLEAVIRDQIAQRDFVLSNVDPIDETDAELLSPYDALIDFQGTGTDAHLFSDEPGEVFSDGAYSDADAESELRNSLPSSPE